MKTHETLSDARAELRRQAEKKARQNGEQSQEDLSAMNLETIGQILHELRVHQIELEIQNEELRLAQAQLDTSKVRYFDLYDLAPVGYITLSETGLILEANLTISTLLGTSRSGLINTPISRFILLEDQDIYYLQYKQLFRTRKPQGWELRMVTQTDTWFWARMEATTATQKDSTLVIRVIVSDITGQKQTEAERKRLTTAIDQSFDTIVITDTDGLIQYINPAFEKATGYTREEVAGQTMRILKSGKQDEGFYQKLWNTISSGRTWTGQMINKRKNGTLFNEEATISPVRNMDGSIINYVAVKRDITEQLLLAVQLTQAQKMESVGRLAGGVAHDYNNALTAIMGFTELALMDADPKGSLHANLNQVLKAGRRATNITRQLLAFARKQTIAPVVLDLNETVESILKMLRRLIGEDIDLVWMPGKDLGNVKMDPSQIDQILANLCVNARDAIEGVGKITIETESIVFDADYCADHRGFVPGKFVLLAVSDNGCGMDKETLSNIFEPFFTTKDVDKGTGLGLSTVYGTVKQNNGFINVYSEPGKGTGIKIYLPRHDGQAVEIQEESTAKIPQGHAETILVVEDDLSLLKLAQKILQGLGYSVLAADATKEALKIAKDHIGEIHLLVTDVIMPEMNGQELSERLKSLHPGLKCIFCQDIQLMPLPIMEFWTKGGALFKSHSPKEIWQQLSEKYWMREKVDLLIKT